MDKMIKAIEGVGEYGIDTEASPGNGQFYVKMYDGSFDACGYDTEEEAADELNYLAGVETEYDCDDSDDAYALASAGFGMDEDYGYACDDY